MDAFPVFVTRLNVETSLLVAGLLAQLIVLWKLCLLRSAVRLAVGVSSKQPMKSSVGGGTTCDDSDSPPSASDPKFLSAAADGVGEKSHCPLRFVMDTLFLTASYRYVRSREEEVFHYVTGARLDESACCLMHIVPVEFSEQSVSGVRVADASNISTLARLDKLGLPLLAHVHSHPAVGPGGTMPSSTDRLFTRRLAMGGHIAIGLLFSRDGHVRFYADESIDFTVDIRGNGVRKVEDNVYAIDMSLAHSDFPLLEDPSSLPERGRSSRSPR